MEVTDQELLQEILHLFSNSNVPDPETQAQVYNELDQLSNTRTDFLFCLLYIASNPSIIPNYRKLSLLLIRRSLDIILPEQLPNFLFLARDNLIKIIETDSTFILTPFVTILFATMITKFGDEWIPQFSDILLQLLTQVKTVKSGIDALTELIQAGRSPPQPILDIIPQILFSQDPSFSFVSPEILTFCHELFKRIPQSHDYIAESIMGGLLSNYQELNPNAFFQANALISEFFLAGETDLGPVLSSILLNDNNSNDLSAIFEVLDPCESLSIPFQADFVIALFRFIGSDFSNEFRLNCQSILLHETEQHGNEVSQALLPLFEVETDRRTLLSALYPLISSKANLELPDFLQYILESLNPPNDMDPEIAADIRGHAAICLIALVTQKSSERPDLISMAIEILLPLIHDENDEVRYMIITEFSKLFNENFVPDKDNGLFPILIEDYYSLFKTDRLNFTEVISTYIKRVPPSQLLKEPYYPFFIGIYQNFMEYNPTVSTFEDSNFLMLGECPYLAFDLTLFYQFLETTRIPLEFSMIGQLMQKCLETIGFLAQQVIPPTLAKRTFILFSIILQVYFFPPNLGSGIYFDQLETVMPIIDQLTNLLTDFLLNDDTQSEHDPDLWSLVSTLGKISPVFFQNYGERWIEVALKDYNGTTCICYKAVAEHFSLFIPQLPNEILSQFALRTIELVNLEKIKLNYEPENDIIDGLKIYLSFLEKIVNVFRERECLPPELYEFYQELNQCLQPTSNQGE